MTFEPSAERGLALDQRMRSRLADSLDYVFDAAGAVLEVDRSAAAGLTAGIRNHPQSPHTFGAYYDLVMALERDADEEARQLARSLTADAFPHSLQIAAIDDRPPSQSDRYRRMFMSDPEQAGAPSPALLADCRMRVTEGLALLDAGFPDMAAEIRTLLREIVVAAGPEDPKAPTFDGASCYMLWGSMLLNARGQTNVLDTAQALAHESGHNLLFGFCVSGPLVDNPDDDLFASPLRTDPRPMDGVVHATYVVARMHQTLSRLLSAGVLDAAGVEFALKDLAAHERNFANGDAIIREHARLTYIGIEAMESARAYMAAA
jgi:HEXXH motif-containing protein